MATAKSAAAKTAAKAKQNTVSLKHIAANLAENHELPKKQTEAMLNDVVALVTKHLKKGDRIRLAGLGVWAMAGVAFGRQNGAHRTGEIRPRSHHPAGPQNESSEGKDGAQPATHRWKDSGHPERLPSKACIGNAHRRSTHPPSLPAGAGPIPRHPARRAASRFLYSLRRPCSPTSIPQRP